MGDENNNKTVIRNFENEIVKNGERGLEPKPGEIGLETEPKPGEIGLETELGLKPEPELAKSGGRRRRKSTRRRKSRKTTRRRKTMRRRHRSRRRR